MDPNRTPNKPIDEHVEPRLDDARSRAIFESVEAIFITPVTLVLEALALVVAPVVEEPLLSRLEQNGIVAGVEVLQARI